MEAFKPEDFMSGPIPDDITLGMAKSYLLTTPILRELTSLSKKVDLVRIRFVWTVTDEDLPDDTTIVEFRALALEKKAHIVVDDGSGGIGVNLMPVEFV